jgi:hypothetical protein
MNAAPCAFVFFLDFFGNWFTMQATLAHCPCRGAENLFATRLYFFTDEKFLLGRRAVKYIEYAAQFVVIVF